MPTNLCAYNRGFYDLDKHTITINGIELDTFTVQSLLYGAVNAYNKDAAARERLKREKRELNERLRFVRDELARLEKRRLLKQINKRERKHRIHTLLAYNLQWENAARVLGCSANTLRDDMRLILVYKRQIDYQEAGKHENGSDTWGSAEQEE